MSVIRRWALRDHISIREKSRRTDPSRNASPNYLCAGSVGPKFKVPNGPRKLDAFADKQSAWLQAEANTLRKQRWAITGRYADLASLGYVGSCGCVAALVRDWQV